ncbi:MAG: hypothetical protein K9N55_11155 [Phycisphaerae bacterium]|nr:hypothetical protein [Phycisphaerae bacterium]
MGQSDSQQGGRHTAGMALSLSVYILFSMYLSWPHWSGWTWSQRILPVSWCVGACGTFLLSRRWIRSLVGAFFSGAMYSFGPLALYIARFHEARVNLVIVALIPWLLCPWAYSHLLVSRRRTWLKQGIGCGLFVLPFVFVAALFRILGQYHLYVMPLNVGGISRQEWFGLMAPLVMVRHGNLFWGVCHIGLGAVFLGGVRLVRTRCWSLILGCLAASAVAVWQPWPVIFGVSPLIWWLFPQILVCICVGLGIVLLLGGGRSDRSWVLGSSVGLTALGVMMLLQSSRYFDFFLWFGFPYARLFVVTGKLYLLGAVGFGLIYVLMKCDRHLLWVRASLVCAMLGCDVCLCASFIVDRVLA